MNGESQCPHTRSRMSYTDDIATLAIQVRTSNMALQQHPRAHIDPLEDNMGDVATTSSLSKEGDMAEWLLLDGVCTLSGLRNVPCFRRLTTTLQDPSDMCEHRFI